LDLILPSPVLCLVTDRKMLSEESLTKVISKAVSGGVNMVQIREKDLSHDALMKLVGDIVNSVHDRALIAVNTDQPDHVFEGVDIIHRAERSLGLPTPDIVGIGRSVHSEQAAIQAEKRGADYLIAGSVFETGSHPGEKGRGIGFFQTVVECVNTPVLAIGGINASRTRQIMAAGAAGIAVVSAILRSPDPEQAAAKLALSMNPNKIN
ncbi:MAG: thiamine phosphate synthase, partial [Chloroflexota bacterium]|nr:thiamine phosphate synthase [Chloroflexota bacterium]